MSGDSFPVETTHLFVDAMFAVVKPSPDGLQHVKRAQQEPRLRPHGRQRVPLGLTVARHEAQRAAPSASPKSACQRTILGRTRYLILYTNAQLTGQLRV